MTGKFVFMDVMVFLLLVIVVIEFIMIISLARHVGRIIQRFGGESGALTTDVGPTIGSVLPFSNVLTHDGKDLVVRGKPTLLLFIQTTCPICEGIIKSIKTLARGEEHITNIIVISRGADLQKHNSFAKILNSSNLHYVINEQLFKLCDIDGVPYGVLVNEELTVSTKGFVNNLSHLESLLNDYNRKHRAS